MDFVDLQNATMVGRFKEAQRDDVKQWLKDAYSEVWNAAEWEFHRAYAVAWAVTAGSRTPTMPVAFAKAMNVIDQDGNPLTYLEPQQFEALYIADTARGAPERFTVVNRQIYLAPTPVSSTSFWISYKRTLAHFLADGVTVTAGHMSADTDLPLWSEDHHEILSLKAATIGLLKENDPTGDGLAARADSMLETMLADLGADPGGSNRQYGRDPLE